MHVEHVLRSAAHVAESWPYLIAQPPRSYPYMGYTYVHAVAVCTAFVSTTLVWAVLLAQTAMGLFQYRSQVATRAVENLVKSRHILQACQ